MWRLLIPIVLVACTDSSAPVTPDAATPDASSNANCLVKDSYGALGSLTGMATGGVNTLSVRLDAGPPIDSFFVKLVAGNGVFASGLAAGTYTISGVDAGYTTCGLCVHIIADLTSTGPSKFYFADSGTVTLTGTGPVVGSAQNLHLVETAAIGNGLPVPGGCSTTIGSISFAPQ